MASRTSASYVPGQTAVLRASTYQGELDMPDVHDLMGDSAIRSLGWLAAQWQRAEIRSAVTYASPALSRQIDEMVAAGSQESKALRRVVISLASYLLRWKQRATPFGLFAGVSSAQIGTTAKVRWGTAHRVAIRADAAWLGDVVANLHRCAPLLERLSVVVNNAGSHRGDRFVAPGPVPDGSGHDLAPIEISVRLTRPIQAALVAARKPLRFSELRDLLIKQFPKASAGQVHNMLAGLVDQGILISSLSPPMDCVDTLGYVQAELEVIDAKEVVEIAATVHEIAAIHQLLVVVDPVASVHDIALINRMRRLSAIADMPLLADTALDCNVELPDQVVREVRDAVHVLHRLSPFPLGYPAWRDYHFRFRARYGIGALVPVLELVADSGLGLPASYLGSSRGRDARQASERDDKLLTLIQRTAQGPTDEIVLTDQVIGDLAPSNPADLHLPGRVEMAVEIRSASVEELTRGRFTLVVTGTPRPGSSMTGRHAHLLSKDGRGAAVATFAKASPGAIAAQLVFAPRKRRNENVVRTERLLPHVIPLAEHHGQSEDEIDLADLGVTADDRRFYLVQISTGRRVEPRVTHALEAGVHTPPLARFLAEITTARASVYKAFHFGAAAKLPYLPRVRYRRTVLSPARWLLLAKDLPGSSLPLATWEAGLDAWRRQWRVPDHVSLVELDRRQPVDLGCPLHRVLLRSRLNRSSQLELREASAPEDLAWLGHAHEVLVPMVLASTDTAGQPSTTLPQQVVAPNAGHLPGNSPVLYAQLYGHPGRFDEILTDHLAQLLHAFGEAPPSWWFRRHRQMSRPDADQYLALYLRLPESSAYDAAARRIAAWANSLRDKHLLSRLALTTYEPQTGRFGHGVAMERAYDVFAADSMAALAQIITATRAGVHPQVMAAASFVDLTATFIGSSLAGTEWLVRELHQEHGRLEPTLRDRALGLVEPHGTWSALRVLPGGADVVTAWRKRAVALSAYREVLRQQRPPLTVLPSLLHLHHIRAVGVDPVLERVTGRLARACALRDAARREEM
ncbi:lantibiotic dehydratase [Actinokineospora terrae]|uniref:Thiopeptide-type bacteriocin biosynthesis domain-containing protein n=1 Tax=Actinokineospora terrae TaxID=155974 RepID=A0A1H9XIF1_9PSEU|nr:lantibiotic dehydratase [Actinokineospora terrae]SES45443.1 thiopeptide-type bacteriocin biosynthesis domain-containing protein [Actinokineospora terrae]